MNGQGALQAPPRPFREFSSAKGAKQIAMESRGLGSKDEQAWEPHHITDTTAKARRNKMSMYAAGCGNKSLPVLMDN